MKTPDEIKKALVYCNTFNNCQNCPYDKDGDGWGCVVERNADAIAYIQQLELMAKPNEQVRWERDVAIGQLRQLGVGFGEKIEAQIPKWISVEERLPDNHGDFLTKIHCAKGDWLEVNTFDHTEKEWWHDAGNRTVDATEFVTHWMPIPEPQKEE